jgi:hypothetical protein
MARSKPDNWSPGHIVPQRRLPSVPISIRMPREIYDGLGEYAKRAGTNRTYLILECLRRLLAARAVRKAPAPKMRSRRIKC